MRIIQYLVDAFTEQPFHGNPAAVCVLEGWLEEKVMAGIAAENNLSETAFIVREGEKYRIRWFTPKKEADLCGHATLASAFVLMNYYDKNTSQIVFISQAGELTVERKGELYEMDFPTLNLKEIAVTAQMEEILGMRPIKAMLGRDMVCVLPDEKAVDELTPDFTKMILLDGSLLHVTAKGTKTDCVSRTFAPKWGVMEDPVCGSAHCQIVPYWSMQLGKRELHARQASARGGDLYCRLCDGGDRIKIAGKALLTAKTEWHLDI